MKTSIRIADCPSDARSTATETRQRLADWVLSIQDKLEMPGIQPLSADAIKQAKADGALAFTSAWDSTNRQFCDVVQALVTVVDSDKFINWRPESARTLSYYFEGIANAASRAVHSTGHKWDALSQYTFLTSLGGRMNWYEPVNLFMRAQGIHAQGIHGSYHGAYWLNQTCEGADESRPYYAFEQEHSFKEEYAELRSLFETVKDQLPQQRRGAWFEAAPLMGPMLLPNGPCIAVVRYTDVDGDWVAGYLSPKDASRMRFTRKRYGAWLTSTGYYTEGDVRARVEAAKTAIAGAEFVVYPNDCLFGEHYTRGVDSCMAADACEYESDGIHPTDVYSSAYFGSGDNGMALFTAERDGNLIGRGIWRDGGIVRWYGDRPAERTLIRLGVETDAEYTLRGSWLHLHTFDGCFVHPYVDGYCYNGTLNKDEERVYLDSSGDFDLENTSGNSTFREQRYCCDTDEYHDEDETVYQPTFGNYRSAECDWLCPVLGEYVEEYKRTTIYLDGEEQEVSDYAIGRRLVECDPSEEMIDDDKDNQGWDDASEGEYEYNGPENYTER